MSFKTKAHGTFDNEPQATQRLERMMLPDLVIKHDEDEESESLKRLSSGKQKRRPKPGTNPREID